MGPEVLELWVQETLELFEAINRGKLGSSIGLAKKKAVGLVFLEPSTRTRLSFERASQLLALPYSVVEGRGSSAEKGESLLDTLLTMESLDYSIFVVRTSEEGALEVLRKSSLNAAIVSAGDGAGEHPTQALLDVCTLLKWVGAKKLSNLKGMRLCIFGDALRSRVAHSWMELAPRLDMELSFCGPSGSLAKEKTKNFRQYKTKKEALGASDILMALRVQKERSVTKLGKDYDKDKAWLPFQLKSKDISKAQWLMAPGPVNWGVELHEELRLHPRSLISKQVTMGLALRTVILRHLCR